MTTEEWFLQSIAEQPHIVPSIFLVVPGMVTRLDDGNHLEDVCSRHDLAIASALLELSQHRVNEAKLMKQQQERNQNA